MTQVLQRCEACGKVETPLVEGRCPACVRLGRQAAHPFDGQTSIDREVEKYVKRDMVLPSTFIWVGLMLESVGLAFLMLGQTGLQSRNIFAAIFVLIALAPLIFGSILLSVGIIRWAIWPLIEQAEERD